MQIGPAGSGWSVDGLTSPGNTGQGGDGSGNGEGGADRKGRRLEDPAAIEQARTALEQALLQPI